MDLEKRAEQLNSLQTLIDILIENKDKITNVVVCLQKQENGIALSRLSLVGGDIACLGLLEWGKNKLLSNTEKTTNDIERDEI